MNLNWVAGGSSGLRWIACCFLCVGQYQLLGYDSQKVILCMKWAGRW